MATAQGRRLPPPPIDHDTKYRLGIIFTDQKYFAFPPMWRLAFFDRTTPYVTYLALETVQTDMRFRDDDEIWKFSVVKNSPIRQNSWACIELDVRMNEYIYQHVCHILCNNFEASQKTMREKGHQYIIKLAFDTIISVYNEFARYQKILTMLQDGDVWEVEELYGKYIDARFTALRDPQIEVSRWLLFERGPQYQTRIQKFGQYWFRSPKFKENGLDGMPRICCSHLGWDINHWNVGCGLLDDALPPDLLRPPLPSTPRPPKIKREGSEEAASKKDVIRRR